MKEIYLDNASSMKPFPSVVKSVEKALREYYGNPSGLHALSEKAMKEINNVRRRIALELGCKAEEIIFTSGATEANNLALFGICENYKDKKNKIIISSIEHPAVWEACRELEKSGFEVKEIPVNSEGLININDLKKEIDLKTKVVSIMHVNNVIGTVQDLKEIGKICKLKKVKFHTDAAQSFSKLKIDVNSFGLDMLSGSAHKIGGPKGVGFLYVRQSLELKARVFGGGQERGLRSGTENVSGIIGFGEAVKEMKKQDKTKMKKLRDLFFNELEKIGGKINGSKTERIYNNVNVSFSGLDSRALVLWLSEKGIMASAGSSCDSKKEIEDRTLKAIGLSKEEAKESIRFSLSHENSKAEVSKVVKSIKEFLDLNGN